MVTSRSSLAIVPDSANSSVLSPFLSVERDYSLLSPPPPRQRTNVQERSVCRETRGRVFTLTTEIVIRRVARQRLRRRTVSKFQINALFIISGSSRFAKGTRKGARRIALYYHRNNFIACFHALVSFDERRNYAFSSPGDRSNYEASFTNGILIRDIIR